MARSWCRTVLIGGFLLGVVIQAQAGLQMLETEHLRLVYFGRIHAFIVPHVARCLENSLQAHRRLLEYSSREKITIFLHDFSDSASASGGAVPVNHVLVGLSPFPHAFETMSVNEPVNAIFNHELVHVIASDQASGSDGSFRTLFFGKVRPVAANPLSLLYGFLTSPREYSPRWYHEGIAVFMETWLSGGLGRALGAYDEMVFRTMTVDRKPLFDLIGLEAAGTKTDFQVGVNSYLYGTRFMSYLALKYGPDSVLRWVTRAGGSRAYFTAQFRNVYGLPLHEAWDQWTRWEREFQEANLRRIRANPVTPDQPLTGLPLGSMSRACFDPATRTLYAAVNYPGQIAHLAAIDLDRRSIRRLTDIKGPALFYVASLAYDPANAVLFYTTDNNDWRDLCSFDVKSGRSRVLLKDGRIGDLAFNPADQAIWGVRHYNGVSTLVRVPPPYRDWKQVRSFPYGQDLYDLDISPDGRWVSAALGEITGRQHLVRMDIDRLIEGGGEPETLFDFENSVPADFRFTPDGRFLLGSSYYTGASNLFRYELATATMSVLTNAETGYFRPIPLSDTELLAMRYTTRGFIPVTVPLQRGVQAAAIRFLGQEVADAHPAVKEWKAGSPAAVDLPALITYDGPYKGWKNLRLVSAYPIVEGYKDTAAAGMRFNLLGPMALHNVDGTISYSPDTSLPAGERVHAQINYSYLNWKVDVRYNAADFYDLFGPRKTSRKGYSLGVQYQHNFIHDAPRTMDLTIDAAGYADLDRLPDHQNVTAPYDRLLQWGIGWNYQNVRSSLGAVDYEKGYDWSIAGTCSYVNNRFFPQVYTTFDYGLPLPLDHSSIWVRTSAGYAYGDRDNPFANFYFGGFGNNWVDHQEVQRYRYAGSFPGVDFDEVGGKNYGKAMVEWTLPPWRFRRLGVTGWYATWARFGLFTTGIVTNMDRDDLRRTLINAGAQVDFRIVVLSNLNLTFSFGYARAFERHRAPSDEIMASLKIF